MRIGITVNDLSAHQWETIQRAVLTEYDIPPRAVRVCALFIRDEEERHVEMPLRAFAAVADLLEREGYHDLTASTTLQEMRHAAGIVRTPAPINDLIGNQQTVEATTVTSVYANPKNEISDRFSPR